MKKNKISGYFLFVSIFTFIAIFFYIVQQSYDQLMKPINQTAGSALSRSINPQLDIATLELIEKRKSYFVDYSAVPASPAASTQ